MTEANPSRAADRLIVMGVSGSGKSTVGAAIARRLELAFVDADALHPAANVAKMAAGTPLDDDDRAPWLAAVGRTLAAEASPGIVIACSALKRSYRDTIRSEASDARFVQLTGTRDLLLSRMSGRGEHFMPTSLLDSQLATLEPLDDDEAGLVVDVVNPVNDIVELVAGWVRPLA